VYDPKARPKPLEALLDPYFDELRDEATRLPNGGKLMDLFNFTIEEYNTCPDVVEQLVPSWYKAKRQF
jgi:hypothetical protein